jgi:hypothetical protein
MGRVPSCLATSGLDEEVTSVQADTSEGPALTGHWLTQDRALSLATT